MLNNARAALLIATNVATSIGADALCRNAARMVMQGTTMSKTTAVATQITAVIGASVLSRACTKEVGALFDNTMEMFADIQQTFTKKTPEKEDTDPQPVEAER